MPYFVKHFLIFSLICLEFFFCENILLTASLSILGKGIDLDHRGVFGNKQVVQLQEDLRDLVMALGLDAQLLGDLDRRLLAQAVMDVDGELQNGLGIRG